MPLEDYIKAQLKTKLFLIETEFLQYQQGQNKTMALICIGSTKNGWKIKGRFLRQELFALKNQFVEWWSQFISILKKHR